MADLTVALHGAPFGQLVGNGAAFDFIPDPDAVRSYGLNSRVLSAAIPLVPRPARAQRATRQNFFAELLPEGDARRRLAREAGISEGDVVGMLRTYGRDVAGAIQVWDPDVPGEPRTPRIETLDDAGVAAMLRDVGVNPLGNKPRGGKTSLNGVQEKIVLVRNGDGWARALDGYPSTHILKPVATRYPNMIFDEEYGSRFARALGLADFDTSITTFAGSAALVIERYDRSAATSDGRIHQEDFNQVLGTAGEEKYETYGRKGLRDVARILSDGDRETLARMVTLSAAVANLDMHLKNISLVHDRSGGFRLAPMYDVVPQNFPEYGNDGEVALAVGGVFDYASLHRDHLIGEIDSWGVNHAEAIVDSTLREIRAIAEAEIPHPASHPGLQQLVAATAANLISGKTTVGGDLTAGEDGRAPAPVTPSRGGGWQWNNARSAPRGKTTPRSTSGSFREWAGTEQEDELPPA